MLLPVVPTDAAEISSVKENAKRRPEEGEGSKDVEKIKQLENIAEDHANSANCRKIIHAICKEILETI